MNRSKRIEDFPPAAAAQAAAWKLTDFQYPSHINIGETMTGPDRHGVTQVTGRFKRTSTPGTLFDMKLSRCVFPLQEPVAPKTRQQPRFMQRAALHRAQQETHAHPSS